MIPDVFLRRSQHRYHLRHCTMLDEWNRGGSGPDGFIVSSSGASFGFLSAQNCHKLSELYIYIYNYRRKFRSQTSDNMDRWKAEMGRVSEEKRRRKKIKKEKVSDERWKIARRCGAKHISKSKCTKHTRSGPLLEVEMSKKCTPLWREAHFEVKSVKNWQVQSTFGNWDVEKVHAVVARSIFRSQNVKNTTCSDHSCWFRCRFAWQAQGIVHLVKSEQNVRVL